MKFVLSSLEASAQEEAGVAPIDVCVRSQGKTNSGLEEMCILLLFYFAFPPGLLRSSSSHHFWLLVYCCFYSLQILNVKSWSRTFRSVFLPLCCLSCNLVYRILRYRWAQGREGYYRKFAFLLQRENCCWWREVTCGPPHPWETIPIGSVRRLASAHRARESL